jgi:hypothetical protein
MDKRIIAMGVVYSGGTGRRGFTLKRLGFGYIRVYNLNTDIIVRSFT